MNVIYWIIGFLAIVGSLLLAGAFSWWLVDLLLGFFGSPQTAVGRVAATGALLVLLAFSISFIVGILGLGK